MKKKMFFLLIAVMSLSLIGIIFVQGYWIKKTYNSKEAQFSSDARQSLIKVAEQVQNNEIDRYYVKYVAMADTAKKPTTASLSQLFHVEKNNLTNETYILRNSILQEDYKIRSNFPGSGQDSIKFKTLVNQKVTLVRKDNIDKLETGLSAQEKFVRVTRLRNIEKQLLLKAIKDKVVKMPVYKRVHKEDLKKLIDKQLALRHINSGYEFGIFSNGLATKVTTGNFALKSPSTYSISIFPSNRTNYKLYIHFTEKNEEIFSSIVKMATLSVIFTLIIIMAYAGAIHQLIKQRRISEIKTDFINNMTHEFKTPIATINLALDSVKNPKIYGDAEKLQNYMKMIRDENHRMHAQVENVLRISKLERNELDIRKERIDIHDLIDDAITHVKLLAENRQGYIKTHFEAAQSAILANESHFVNVLVNIIDNGIKYSEDAPKIDVYTENTNNTIIVKISDQGNGMSKSVQKKIFNKFYREHTGDIHNVKGHGLGLSYVKNIVEDHQGEITVESEKGKGSTFIIKLPLIS